MVLNCGDMTCFPTQHVIVSVGRLWQLNRGPRRPQEAGWQLLMAASLTGSVPRHETLSPVPPLNAILLKPKSPATLHHMLYKSALTVSR